MLYISYPAFVKILFDAWFSGFTCAFITLQYLPYIIYDPRLCAFLNGAAYLCHIVKRQIQIFNSPLFL